MQLPFPPEEESNPVRKAINDLYREIQELKESLAPKKPKLPEWSNAAPMDDAPLGTIEVKSERLVRIRAERGWDTRLRDRQSISDWFESKGLPIPDLAEILDSDVQLPREDPPRETDPRV